ncbi:prostate and testis expressed protein 1 isoform X4 [Peromyscus eremicus]|uniref:prostate and testis expressed protein 1 isoform X4 n=1 Tax=Peromyscus eremicus TaxID=42410 RepID=UPI0027DE6018|nr:prostate and testis expressed protein 1 isoform X4 [Peromyscus eremicus]
MSGNSHDEGQLRQPSRKAAPVCLVLTLCQVTGTLTKALLLFSLRHLHMRLTHLIKYSLVKITSWRLCSVECATSSSPGKSALEEEEYVRPQQKRPACLERSSKGTVPSG